MVITARTDLLMASVHKRRYCCSSLHAVSSVSRRIVRLTRHAETDIRPTRAEAVFASVYLISGVCGTESQAGYPGPG